MFPFFSIAGISISTYLLMFYGVGGASVFVAAIARAKKYRLTKIKACALTAIFLSFGVLGAKIAFWLESPSENVNHFLDISNGYNFVGAVFLVGIAAWCFGRFFGLRSSESLDFSAALLALIISFIRIGCYLGGCCYGEIGDMTIPNQLFEACGDFYIFVYLVYSEYMDKFAGRHWFVFAAFYGFWRFFWELSMPLPDVFIGLSLREFMSLALGFAGLVLLLVNVSRCKHRKVECSYV